LRILSFYYDLLAGFEGSPDDDAMGWALMFASWCRRIIPTPKNKFEYGITHILVLSFAIAVFAQKQATAQKKIYDYWSGRERLKARGLSQKRTAWGLIGEKDENNDSDESSDEEEEVAVETKGDGKEKKAKKEKPATASSGDKPRKKGDKLKKDQMPVPVMEAGATPFWAANAAGMQAIPKQDFTWQPEGFE
jgi:hypothetical protein